MCCEPTAVGKRCSVASSGPRFQRVTSMFTAAGLIRAYSTKMSKWRIRKFRLRIFVEHFQIGMGRCGVQVVIELLAIFSVIALRIGKAKETLFENWITPVPESEGETEPLMVIAEAGESIFAPTVSTAARLVVGKISPRIAIRAIVLAHGAPLAFAQVRPPFAPETILRFVVLLLLDSEKFGLSGKSGAVQAECVGSSFTGDPFQTFARIRKWLHRLQ